MVPKPSPVPEQAVQQAMEVDKAQQQTAAPQPAEQQLPFVPGLGQMTPEVVHWLQAMLPAFSQRNDTRPQTAVEQALKRPNTMDFEQLATALAAREAAPSSNTSQPMSAPTTPASSAAAPAQLASIGARESQTESFQVAMEVETQAEAEPKPAKEPPAKAPKPAKAPEAAPQQKSGNDQMDGLETEEINDHVTCNCLYS